ncbi:MAG: site-specific DNA-methyltransferase [Candidatus Pacearchaeota archaeon]
MSHLLLLNADSTKALKEIPDKSINFVFGDPPYPLIKRKYGYWSEEDWHGMMDLIVPECMRILKPNGSALFVLQPNYTEAGNMSLWAYEFLLKWGKRYGIPQDLYWWNYVSLPGGGATKSDLCRGTVKLLVWLGPKDCYRDQNEILWDESSAGVAHRSSKRFLKEPDVHTSPSGYKRDRSKVYAAAERRGGVTPFNIFPVANNISVTKHPASTPIKLCSKLISYLCPIDGVVLDPFCGGANIGVASSSVSRYYIGIEKDPTMYSIAMDNVEDYMAKHPLVYGGEVPEILTQIRERFSTLSK